jgi:hypothetical protein
MKTLVVLFAILTAAVVSMMMIPTLQEEQVRVPKVYPTETNRQARRKAQRKG